MDCDITASNLAKSIFCRCSPLPNRPQLRANASEASEIQELNRRSRSKLLTTSHPSQANSHTGGPGFESLLACSSTAIEIWVASRADNSNNHPALKDGFRQVSKKTAELVGTPAAFLGSVLLILIWGGSGPLFHFSDTWQLVSTPRPPSSRF